MGFFFLFPDQIHLYTVRSKLEMFLFCIISLSNFVLYLCPILIKSQWKIELIQNWIWDNHLEGKVASAGWERAEAITWEPTFTTWHDLSINWETKFYHMAPSINKLRNQVYHMAPFINKLRTYYYLMTRFIDKEVLDIRCYFASKFSMIE